MKTITLIPLLLLAFLSIAACSPDTEAPTPEVPEQPQPDEPETPDEPGDEDDGNNDDPMENGKIKLTVNGNSFTATLEANDAVEALKERLAREPIQIRMDDYGDMEKVGALGFSLPRNDVRTTTSAGDMILYQGNSVVLFYGSNTWSYTRLGRVDGVSTREQMLDLLGGKRFGYHHVLIAVESAAAIKKRSMTWTCHAPL